MTDVGKFLLFYLKYPIELERLYESSQPDVTGLAEPDHVLARTRAVGDAATQEAFAFLECCVPSFREHFEPLCDLKRVRSNLRNTWKISFRIIPRSEGAIPFEIGFGIYPRLKAVVPWIWIPGGRRSEETIMTILPGTIKSTALDFQSGTVGLAKIDIPIVDRLDVPVPTEPVVAKVRKAFHLITAREIAAIIEVGKRSRTLDEA